MGHLGEARVVMQIEVGVGDVVTPDAQSIVYPTLLDFPYAELLGYPRQTVVAGKFHAVVCSGATNSRMKDCHDAWLLASEFRFDGEVLTGAINATIAHRNTAVDPTPIANPSLSSEPAEPRLIRKADGTTPSRGRSSDASQS